MYFIIKTKKKEAKEMLKPDYDVIVIGAGAAGLATTRTLHDQGYTVLVLEARDRLGGRTHTDYDLLKGYPLELGGEFIHGQHAPTHALAHAFGFSTIQAPRRETLRWGDHSQVAVSLEQLPEPLRSRLLALRSTYQTLLHSTLADDLSLADYFKSQGFTSDEVSIADVLFAQPCCAPAYALSCLDLIHEAQRDRAGEQDFRIRQGYSQFFARYSEGLPIRFNSAVEQIEWRSGNVTVSTAQATFTASRCVITIPIGVLQSGQPRFSPALPIAKQHAIATYRMEGATKLIYVFDQLLWDADLVYMAHATGRVGRWWTPMYRSDTPFAVLTAFLTADLAQTIDSLTEAEALQIGLEEGSSLLGISISTLQHHLQQQRRVSWAHDPFARGGYAYIPVGGTKARAEMNEPIDDTLYFAGEAYATMSNPQTVHGAMESGWAVAQRMMQTASPFA